VVRRCVLSRILVNEEAVAHSGLLGKKKKMSTLAFRRVFYAVLQT
jgi:hypothetical protein